MASARRSARRNRPTTSGVSTDPHMRMRSTRPPSSKRAPRARCARRIRPSSSLTKGINRKASDSTVPRAATGMPRCARGRSRRTTASLICVAVVEDETARENPTRIKMRTTAVTPLIPPAGSSPTGPASGTAPCPSQETRLATRVNIKMMATGRMPRKTRGQADTGCAQAAAEHREPRDEHHRASAAVKTPSVATRSKAILTRASRRAAGASGVYAQKAPRFLPEGF